MVYRQCVSVVLDSPIREYRRMAYFIMFSIGMVCNHLMVSWGKSEMLNIFLNRRVLVRAFVMSCVVLALLIGAMRLSLAQGDSLNNVVRETRSSIKDGVRSQRSIDSFDEQITHLVYDYRAALSQLESLREYNAQLQKLIDSQKVEIVKINQQIEGVTKIDRGIIPHMFRMIDGLEVFINIDVPFLIDVRRDRVARLRSLMNESDSNQAEKYRKILEAFEIENEYGRTIEAYEGELMLNGSSRTVSYLRLGRVVWIYQTLDGSESAIWDQNKESWIDLEGDFDTELRINFQIAREQAAPNLLILPLISTLGEK